MKRIPRKESLNNQNYVTIRFNNEREKEEATINLKLTVNHNKRTFDALYKIL